MIEGNIERWSPGDPVPNRGILLIRHGPRKPGPFPRHDVPLTEEGVKLTRKMGMEWKGPTPVCILTSPVPRNRQTAEALAEAADWQCPIYDSNMLGNNGPFVVQPDAVNQLVKAAHEAGNHDFLNEHIAGKQMPGMLHRDLGVQRLLTDLQYFRGKDDLVVAISHDYIISSVLAFFGENPDPWPEPLCGVVLF